MENKKRRRKSLISRLNDKIAVTYLMNMLDMVKEFSYR